MTLFVGCGVDSSSSQSRADATTDTNSSGDVNASADANSSGDTNASTDGNATVVTNPIFDTTEDAQYDADACNSGKVNALPIQDTSKSATETFDKSNGIAVKSFLRETGVPAESAVNLYYNRLPTGTVLEGNTTTFYGINSLYYVSYDLVWTTVTDNRVYVKIPPQNGTKPECFRIVLDQEQGTSIQAQKVYR